MDIDESFLTLLTPDGQFLRARNEGHQYQVGQEIQFNPIEVRRKNLYSFSKLRSSFKAKALAAAMLAILVGGSVLFPVYKSNQVYAYMSIDGQSNIELEVNKKLQVIGINSYNKQGEEIISNIGEWEKEDLSAVSSNIINEMKKQGLMDDEVVFSSTVKIKDDENIELPLEEKIVEIKKQADEHDANLVVVNGTKEERKEAADKGVTLGQLKKSDQIKKNKKLKNKQSQPAITEEPVKEQEQIKKQEQSQNQSLSPDNDKKKTNQWENENKTNHINKEVEKQSNGNYAENKQYKKQEQSEKKNEKHDNKKDKSNN